MGLRRSFEGDAVHADGLSFDGPNGRPGAVCVSFPLFAAEGDQMTYDIEGFLPAAPSIPKRQKQVCRSTWTSRPLPRGTLDQNLIDLVMDGQFRQRWYVRIAVLRLAGQHYLGLCWLAGVSHFRRPAPERKRGRPGRRAILAITAVFWSSHEIASGDFANSLRPRLR